MNSNEPLPIDFRKPNTLDEVAHFIGIPETILERAIREDKTRGNGFDRLYWEHKIPKNSRHRTGEFRIVWQAGLYLEDAHKSFARRFDLFSRWVEPRFIHDSTYGYVRGRNTIDNANRHCSAKLILHADIKNFFPSISADRVKAQFQSMGIQDGASEILKSFVTIDGVLPLGLHASPLLANLICLNLDEKFFDLSKKYGCSYTRYADDITISGNSSVPTKNEVRDILGSEAFALSERKFRVTKPGQAHYVTGLSVTDSKPRAPRSMKKRLRQELHYIKKFGLEDHLSRFDVDHDFVRKGINRIDGTIRYVSYIEKESLPKLKSEWQKILEKENREPSYRSSLDNSRHYHFYVDETEFHFQGSNFLALAIVKTDDPNQITVTAESTLRKHLVDPYSGGRKKNLEKKLLHFTDANDNLRMTYTDKLGVLPYRAYVAYRKLNSRENYSEVYQSLIKSLLPHRLMSCANDSVELIFEENSTVRESEVRACVEEILKSLGRSDNLRPVNMDVTIGKKVDHHCFSVPDFLLGVFSKYATSNWIKEKDSNLLFFEKLRDKYRLILDADSNRVFSRKRPFLPWPATRVPD